MKITVACDWVSAGEVRLNAGHLEMPRLPSGPGVYQWVFRHDERERRYVGEAQNLEERFDAYRRGVTGRSTNLRMYERAARVLTAGGSVEILLAVDIGIVRGELPVDVDLASRQTRRLVESAVFADLLEDPGEVVNGEGFGELRHDKILG